MGIVDQVVYLFRNKEWKSVEDIKHNCPLPESQIELVLDFFTQFDFLEKNNINETFRISHKFAIFLDSTKNEMFSNK